LKKVIVGAKKKSWLLAIEGCVSNQRSRPMKATTLAAIVALLLMSALAWGAGQSLKSTMRGWKVATQVASAMVNGGVPFDAAKVRGEMETFAADSQALNERLSATTAEGKDIRQRFAVFNVDSVAALAVLGNRDQFRISYAKVIGECKSCHNQYAN
jgi:cytochrome c556